MARERAIIQSVKNDVVTVSIPYIQGNKSTYTTASLAAAGTTLTVKDNSGFIDDEYLMLGEAGAETTEIVRIDGTITRGTSLTISACVFAHPTGTPVTHMRYNKVAIYGSTSAADTAPTAIGSAEAIDVSNGKNEIKASTTYSYYYARYYDEVNNTYSAYSDSVAAAGLSARARGEIKKEFLSIYNERIDDLITDDWLNRTINRWQRELNKRKKRWACLRDTSIQDLTEDVQSYALPTDIYDDDSSDSIVSVRIHDQSPLSYVDEKVFTSRTYDYVGSTVSTAASVGDTTLTLTDSSDFTQLNGACYSKGVKIGFTLNTESTGVLSGLTAAVAITAFADAGSGYTTVTAAGHGLSNGDTVYIGSTRNYDGSYTVSGVSGDDFNIYKTYVADDATGACSTVDSSITETLAAGSEVWQNYTSGQPVYYTIDDGYIKLDPIPDSTWDLKNLYIEYWQKFPDLSDDADETLFHSVENCYLYLNYQVAILRRLDEDVIMARQAVWKDDLEDLVAEDPEFRDVRIQPRNLYQQKY